MIQKIRSYLLDNKENKESIGWYVAIIMLVPIFSYFFISKNSKINSVGCVNGTEINASIFNLKLYQQSMLLETIYKQLGKKEADYLVSLFFQGRSPEEFILIDAIRHAYLSGFFSKYISREKIARGKVLFESQNNDNGFRQVIGEVFHNIIRRKSIDEKLGSNFERFISIKEVDSYVEDLYQNNFLAMLFASFVGGIEKRIFLDFFIPKKLELISFTFDKNKNGQDYQKLIRPDSVSEEELRSFYENGLTHGKYHHNKRYVFSFIKYGIKDTEKKDFLKVKNKEERKEKLEKILSGLLSTHTERKKESYEAVLEEHFVRHHAVDKVNIEIIEGKKKASVILPAEVLDFVVSSIVDGVNVIVVNDSIFFLYDMDELAPARLSFDDARSLVLKDLLDVRTDDLIHEKINAIRYELEENGSLIEKGLWLQDEMFFDVVSTNKKNEVDMISRSILRKINSGGMRQGASFWVRDGNKFTVFYVKSMGQVEGDLPALYTKRENAVSSGLFLEGLLHQAKIDIYENKQEKKDKEDFIEENA